MREKVIEKKLHEKSIGIKKNQLKSDKKGKIIKKRIQIGSQ